MAYTKQTWTSGETVTSAKLNHMEDGIAEGGSGGGVFVVNFTYDEQTQKYTADKTLQEIGTAAMSGSVIGHVEHQNPVFPGITHVFTNQLQFTSVYVSGSAGVIGVLEAELDEETYEPTGLWTLTNYSFNVTNPEQ